MKDSFKGLFEEVDNYLQGSESSVFDLAILSIENLSIIERNFGSKIFELIDGDLHRIFSTGNKNGFFLRKIHYGMYLFVVGHKNIKSSIEFIENILDQINTLSGFFEENVFCISKIGCTHHNKGEDIQKSFNQAQVALFECRYEERSYTIYGVSLQGIQKHINYIDLLAVFFRAMRESRLAFEYQPLVDSKTRKIVSYECLLRIVDYHGYQSSAFSHIRAAEEYSFISKIDKFVLQEATKVLEEKEDIKLHINISGITVTNSDWIELAHKLFYKKNFHNRLTVEITETAAIRNLKEANFFTKALNEIGCAVFIDDFGSGYSSYMQLKNIGLNGIKIGAEYTKNIVSDKTNLAFVTALIKLAKDLNLKVVAEHIDNKKVADLLEELGVDYLQGHLFYVRPSYIDAFNRSE